MRERRRRGERGKRGGERGGKRGGERGGKRGNSATRTPKQLVYLPFPVQSPRVCRAQTQEVFQGLVVSVQMVCGWGYPTPPQRRHAHGTPLEGGAWGGWEEREGEGGRR